MKPDGLSLDLAALRKAPGVHLPTLRRVDDVISKHAGARVTLSRGQAKKQRLDIARAVSSTAETRHEAVSAIMGAMGVSRATAFRYLRIFEREAAASRATNPPVAGAV